MKIGDKVKTQDFGFGVIVGKEELRFGDYRFAVRLDNPELWSLSATGQIPHYFPKELVLEKSEN
jgi:hypothetical protein